MAAEDKEFDIVIFGASGFTGKLVVEELSRVANENNIKWAIAGRTMKKLEAVLSDVTNSTGQDYSDIQILIADTQNYESLLEMCTKAKCLINCCGPFVNHGPKVVEACIECKTHHVDVSGEPLFLEKVQLQYNGPARENDVYIVGSCAFRCLPIDVGIMYTSQKFDGDLNNVEAYLSIDGPVKAGLSTYECQVYGFQHRNELRAIRKSLFTTKDYEFQHVVKPKSGLFYDKDSSKYCSVWPDAYRSIVYRSQRFLQDHEKKRPTQYAFYFCITICYDCTSWNPYCASSVDSPFPEAVATVECNITKTCFIRKEKDGMVSRGCADWWMFSSIVSDYLGCQEQVPAWLKPQEWCFCDTDLCNGQSMADVKKLNDEVHEFNQDAENPVEMVSDEEEMESEEVDVMERHVPHSSSSVTTILPWWWWYVHWSTERPYWMDGKAKHSGNNNNNNNRNNNNNNRNKKQKINGIRGIRTKEFEDSPAKFPKTTQKDGWESSKTTKHSGHWEAAAVPTGASAADKVQKVKPKNIKQADKIAGGNNLEASKNEIEESWSDFFCWDCYDDNPLCGEVVQTPVNYYVGRVACPVTQKCFIRKDNGVTYRGCADGWKDSSVDYFYVGCRNQTIWGRNVEWCFCSSPLCNSQSMDSLRMSHLPIAEKDKSVSEKQDPQQSKVQ